MARGNADSLLYGASAYDWSDERLRVRAAAGDFRAQVQLAWRLNEADNLSAEEIRPVSEALVSKVNRGREETCRLQLGDSLAQALEPEVRAVLDAAASAPAAVRLLEEVDPLRTAWRRLPDEDLEPLATGLLSQLESTRLPKEELLLLGGLFDQGLNRLRATIESGLGQACEQRIRNLWPKIGVLPHHYAQRLIATKSSGRMHITNGPYTLCGRKHSRPKMVNEPDWMAGPSRSRCVNCSIKAFRAPVEVSLLGAVAEARLTRLLEDEVAAPDQQLLGSSGGQAWIEEVVAKATLEAVRTDLVSRGMLKPDPFAYQNGGNDSQQQMISGALEDKGPEIIALKQAIDEQMSGK